MSEISSTSHRLFWKLRNKSKYKGDREGIGINLSRKPLRNLAFSQSAFYRDLAPFSETGFLAKTLQKNQDFWSETRFLAGLLRMVQDVNSMNFSTIETAL
jgi:hypothetical protein